MFQFNPPLSKKLHNYSKTLKDVQDMATLQHLLQNSCQCNASPFAYLLHGHVITGDLQILPTQNLRVAFSKGSKFRLPVFVTNDKLLRELTAIFDCYCFKISKRNKIAVGNFIALKRVFIELIEARVALLPKGHNSGTVNLTGSDWRSLRRFQERFVVVPADKATGNYIIVCKNFYLSVLCEELGITHQLNAFTVNGNAVYTPASTDIQLILNKHASFSFYLGCLTKAENKVLPKIFAVPKLHKNPYKFRFIAGAHYSTLKDVSVLLHRILQFLKVHFWNYTAIASQRTGNGFTGLLKILRR